MAPDQSPDAVQLVVFVELHVSVVDPFTDTPGGDAESCRRWLRSYNHHLAGVPAELVRTVGGLAGVAEYLDAMRGHG